jgi:hypothetical protein
MLTDINVLKLREHQVNNVFDRNSGICNKVLFAVALFLPAVAHALTNEAYTLVSKDANGDGITDVMLRPNTKMFVLPFDDDVTLTFPIPNGFPTVFLESNGTSLPTTKTYATGQAPTADATWQQDKYWALYGDVDGDQRVDLMLISKDGTQSSYVLRDMGDKAAPALSQAIKHDRLSGYIQKGYQFALKDVNADGQVDIEVRNGDIVIDVLLAGGMGLYDFASPPTEEARKAIVQTVWSDFGKAVTSRNRNGSLNLVTREQREHYQTIFDEIGMDAVAETLAEIKSFKPVEIGEDLATYAAVRQVGSETVVNFVSFFRQANGAWGIASM